MLRNLNRQYAGRRVLDICKTGVLGTTIPTSGTSGGGYLSQDVVNNSWQASEVRGRITSTNLPAGSWYAWNDSRLQINSGTPDGVYNLSFERFVFGVPQSELGTITFNLGTSAGTATAAITLDSSVFSGVSVGSGGIVQFSISLDGETVSIPVTGAIGTVSSFIILNNVTTSLSAMGQVFSDATINVTLDSVDPAIYALSYFPTISAAISLENAVFTGSASGTLVDPTTILLDSVVTDLNASGSYIQNATNVNVPMPIPLGLTLEGKLVILV